MWYMMYTYTAAAADILYVVRVCAVPQMRIEYPQGGGFGLGFFPRKRNDPLVSSFFFPHKEHTYPRIYLYTYLRTQPSLSLAFNSPFLQLT